jgi:E3 ubiquitin-protein ligase DOA10
MAFATNASANPVPVPLDAYVSSVESGLAYIFAVNLPVDLILLASSVLLAGRLFGQGVGRLIKDPDRFVSAVVLAGVMVAVAGAFIDFYLLYTGEFEIRQQTVYVYQFDLLNSLVAASLVALSIYAVCVLMLRLDKVVALIPAAIIAVVNFVSWSALTDGYGPVFDPKSIAIVAFIAYLVVPMPLLALRAWHRSRVVA